MPLIIALCLALSLALTPATENTNMMGFDQLQQYEAQLAAQQGDLRGQLDALEAYIRENQTTLGITRYTRNDDNIFVKFDNGLSYVAMPRPDSGTDSIE